MTDDEQIPEPEDLASVDGFLELLALARQGSNEALGEIIGACRHYLLAIAHAELPEELRSKLAAADLVQDSCLEAQQGFSTFSGQTQRDLLAWLRGILLFNISNARRHYLQTAKRNLGLEEPLEMGRIPRRLYANQDSPSHVAMANEERALVENALKKLPEHLREAVLLRHRDHLSFAEIGERLDRSPEAARKLWVRAIEQMQKELQLLRKP